MAVREDHLAALDAPQVLLSVALVFVFLLTGHWTTAVVFAGATALILGGWHWREASTDLVGFARRALPNGWWGMAIFLCSETALFGSLIGTYFYLRFTSPQWPLGGIPAPSVAPSNGSRPTGRPRRRLTTRLAITSTRPAVSRYEPSVSSRFVVPQPMFAG